jgi:hypothetical protein
MMLQTLDDEVHAQAPVWRRGLTRMRRMRRLTVVGIAALMLAVPVAVSASHIFSDVPTSNTFHASISTLYGARITGGCATGKYCPDAAVTRGQMAAFLVRGLGRMANAIDFGDDDWVPFTGAPVPPDPDHPFGVAAPLTFRHGGGAGGTAHVFATGNIDVWTDEPGVCPCEVQARLVNADTLEESLPFFGMIGSEFAPVDPDAVPAVAYAETSMTLSHAFSVASGAVNDYFIAVKITPTNPPTAAPAGAFNTGWGATLQTIYVPFDANGQNPTTTTTQGPKPRGPRAN